MPGIFHQRSGFTFIEMIVVIIVIGVMITLALPNYAFVMEKTRSGEGLQILESIRHAQWTYYYENGNTFAEDLDDLDLVIPVPVHFDTLTDAHIYSAATINDRIGRVTRTGGAYELEITPDGAVTCTGGGDVCSKLGL